MSANMFSTVWDFSVTPCFASRNHMKILTTNFTANVSQVKLCQKCFVGKFNNLQ